jgi:hypothetical protein
MAQMIDGDHSIMSYRRQVLTEQPVGQRAAQPHLPPVVVLPRIGVHRLLIAAVVPDVEDLLTDQTTVQPDRLRPWLGSAGLWLPRPADRRLQGSAASYPSRLGSSGFRSVDCGRKRAQDCVRPLLEFACDRRTVEDAGSWNEHLKGMPGDGDLFGGRQDGNGP